MTVYLGSALSVFAALMCLLDPAPGMPQSSPEQILSATRQALGGDAALSGVRSFVVTGRAEKDLGIGVADQEVELACELPDRFVRRVRYNAMFGDVGTGMARMTAHRDGFAGTSVIRETTIGGAFPPVPPSMPALPPLTPADRTLVEQTRVLEQKHVFARLALVLFAASPAAYPLQFSSPGPVTLPDGRTADAVDAAGPDGVVIRLLVDAVSHLPVILTWRERAVIATPTSVPLPRGARNSGFPPGTVVLDRPLADPTRVPFVEHVLMLSDFRRADGLNWPHRFTERVNGEVLEDTKLGKFKLNGKIPAGTFSASGGSR